MKGIEKNLSKSEPRGALCPHDWLPKTINIMTLRYDDKKAITLITLLQYLGWRAEAVTRLKMIDITTIGNKIRVKASRFKTNVKGGLPECTVSLSKLPKLMLVVLLYI